MENKLIVCTEAASFMAGAFDTEEMREEAHSQAQRLSKKYGGCKSHHTKPEIDGIYFHGKLWDDMGYDLVNAVGGELPQLKIGDEIKCIAVLPDDIDYDTGIILEEGKEVDATLYVGNRPNFYAGDNSGLYCLILYSSEKFNKNNTDNIIWSS